MSENSKIEWCHHTFNGWIGCTKVSPGCANCYAERDNARRKWNKLGWGKGVPRHRTKTWGDPVRWNKQAQGATERPRVFCSSLSDWLDDEVPIEWLADLLELIRITPNIDWLLLTKRPQNWKTRIGLAARCVRERGGDMTMLCAWGHGNPPANVWMGTTVENQDYAERCMILCDIPAAFRFVSYEPALGPVNLRRIDDNDGNTFDALTGEWGIDGRGHIGPDRDKAIHWVICGGESGPGARPMQAAWAQSIRDQCAAANVPFLFKQWGEWLPKCQYADLIADIDPDHWNHASSRDGGLTRHIGKKNAGRLLDGREWNGYPQ